VLNHEAVQSLGRRVAGGSIQDKEGSEKVKSRHSGKSAMRTFSFLSGLLSFSLWVGVLTFFYAPAAAAQEGPEVLQEEEEPELTQEEIERYENARKAARNQRIEKGIEENETGTDPRSFALQWAPYYRYTELDNGLIQQDLVAFGVVGFTPRLGMFYELPVAQHRDFSNVPGFPADADSKVIGMGDWNLKFLFRPEALEMTYGEKGEKSGSVLLGTEFILPTATDDALAGNAFVFSPILGVVFDMPLHGFVALLNLYQFDVFKGSSAPDTSRYVGRLFYMQPLTPPGKWWGGLYLLPEIQPIYDFEADDFSIWIGPEFGKMFAPGRIGYIKPGWGISNSEPTDRKFTVEVGFRWFF
jgi:hypothetical protein